MSARTKLDGLPWSRGSSPGDDTESPKASPAQYDA